MKLGRQPDFFDGRQSCQIDRIDLGLLVVRAILLRRRRIAVQDFGNSRNAENGRKERAGCRADAFISLGVLRSWRFPA